MVQSRQDEQRVEDLKNDLSVSSLSFLSVSYIADQMLGKLDIETPQGASKKKKKTIKPEDQKRSRKAENFDKVTAVLQPNTIRKKGAFTPAQISKEQVEKLKLHPCWAVMRHLNLPIRAPSEKATWETKYPLLPCSNKIPHHHGVKCKLHMELNFFTVTSHHSPSPLGLCKRRPFTTVLQ